jgi:hypothetical protein
MDKNWLAHYFVECIVRKSGNIQTRIERALVALAKLEEQGWMLEEIKNEMDLFAQTYPAVVTNIYHIEEIMGNKEAPNNLMESGVFYYHNRLRNVPPPPKMKFDKETRQYIRIEQPFFLEMKKRFSMPELLEYWYTSNGMKATEHNLKQDTGKFKYLLGMYDLDEVLFMIDVAQSNRREANQRPLRNAFELEKFLEEARDAIKLKKNVHRVQGIDQEIQRKVE